MLKQITEFVQKCSVCQGYRNMKDPMVPHELPDKSFQKKGIGIFHFDDKLYLVTVDYYSRYFETDWLHDTHTSDVIQKLCVHLTRYGMCDILLSDNIPQFASHEFAQFTKDWNFVHTASSPYYSWSNGLEEKCVSVEKSS